MFQELGNGVFRRRYETLDENVGVVIGDQGVLVIDTRSTHQQGDQIRSDLTRLTPLRVRWVVNTHWHWDHVFGNSRFRDAEIWGHARTADALTDRPAEMRAGAFEWLDEEMAGEIAAVEIVAPNRTFADRVSLDIGRAVGLSHHGKGHTDGDIRITVADSGVTFLGDLVEEGAPPSFGDSYPMEWPITLGMAMEDVAGPVVPGHGDVVDHRFVVSQHEELAAVAKLASSFVAGEISREQAASCGPYPAAVLATALDRALLTAPAGEGSVE